MQFFHLIGKAASNKWLVNIINVLILLLLADVFFVLFSGGAVLKFTLLGFHMKISLRHIINPSVFLIVLTIIRFCLWWSQVGAAQYQAGDEETRKERSHLRTAVDKGAEREVLTQAASYSKGNMLTMVIILLITVVACIWLYTVYLTQTSGLVLWDMAEHGFWGVKIANDIENFDIKSLFIHTHEQRLWPFVHSYLLAGFFLLFGSSVDTATVLSICGFALLIFFLALTSLNLSKKDGWFVGILACFFALTSNLYLIFSVLIMLEIFGALFTVIGLFLYFKAIESGSHKYYFLNKHCRCSFVPDQI
jgi:hypothetical protein